MNTYICDTTECEICGSLVEITPDDENGFIETVVVEGEEMDHKLICNIKDRSRNG